MPHFWQTTNARMHRIVFLVSTDVLAYPETRQDCIDVEVEIKDTPSKQKQETIPSQPPHVQQSFHARTSKSMRTIVMEALLHYCRLVYDVYNTDKREVATSLLLGDTVSKPILVNDWQVEQQSFQFIVQKMGQSHAAKVLSELENKARAERENDSFVAAVEGNVGTPAAAMEEPHSLRKRLIMQVCDHLHSDPIPCSLLGQHDHVSHRLIYILHPPSGNFSAKGFENGRLIELFDIFANHVLQKYSGDELKRSVNTIVEFEVVVPITRSMLLEQEEPMVLDIHQTHTIKSFTTVWNEKYAHLHRIVELLQTKNVQMDLKVTYISMQHFWDAFMERAMRHHGLLQMNIQGIPMLKTNTKANVSCDVQIACKGFVIDVSQDIHATKPHLNFMWSRTPQKSSTEHLYTTKSAHKITPIHPYTLPTLCLLKHLAAGKPAILILETTCGCRKADQNKVSHMLLQHGQDVYLHVLHLNRIFQPRMTIPRPNKPVVIYRMNEFMDMIRGHMLQPPSESAAHNRKPFDDTNLFNNDEPLLSDSDMEDESSNNQLVAQQPRTSKITEDDIFCMIRHNHYLYQVPLSIERHTRLFPLCHDPESVLFNVETSPILINEITPLLDNALQKENMQFGNGFARAKKMLKGLYNCIQNNDTKLLPELTQMHSQRWEVYKKLWSELRIFFITLNHYNLQTVMDKLWPHFFYDSTSGDNKGSNERRNKKMIEVQRDRHGNVMFPVILGSLTVHSLGKVVWDRPAYHNEKYIWTVGFKSTRYYTSVVNVERRCMYTCEIRDGGDLPSFVLTSEDCPDQPIVAASATAAWTVIVKKVNEIKTEEQGKRVFTNVSGPEYFGLAHPTVMKLISELPNAEKCDRPNAPFQPAIKSKPEERRPDDFSVDNSAGSGAVTVITALEELEKEQDQFAQQPHLSKGRWQKGFSLYDVFAQRNERIESRSKELDGRKNGPAGLYSQTFATSTASVASVGQQQDHQSSGSIGAKRKNQEETAVDSVNSSTKTAKRKKEKDIKS